jgi:hypothetical protein
MNECGGGNQNLGKKFRKKENLLPSLGFSGYK